MAEMLPYFINLCDKRCAKTLNNMKIGSESEDTLKACGGVYEFMVW